MNEKIEEITKNHNEEIEKLERELNSHVKVSKG